MEEYKIMFCSECSAKLFSTHSKKLGVCPECINPDSDVNADLEDKFEELFSK